MKNNSALTKSTAAASLLVQRGEGCFNVTDTSLELTDIATFDSWKRHGSSIAQVAEAGLFWLGDWLNAGKATYGTKYSEALEILGGRYEYQSLANIACVCAKVCKSARNSSLSFSHHREVIALPEAEQREWLRRAVTHNWTVSTLREKLRERAELADTNEVAQKSSSRSIGQVAQAFASYKRSLPEGAATLRTWETQHVEAVLKEMQPIAEFYSACLTEWKGRGNKK